jgi:poly(beta-D-mannuronate) lyase
MLHRAGPLLLLFAAFFACGAPASADKPPLHSPWDSHPVTLTDAPFTCPAAPHLSSDLLIGSYYTDEHHSIVDPAMKKAHDDAASPFTDFARAVVRAADHYRSTGSRAAAQCVLSLLETAAHDRVLAGKMLSGQAYYEQGWNLSAWAVAYLKVRDSNLATPDQTKTISSWFKEMAEQNRDYYDQKSHNLMSDAHNNHEYWAGVALAAAAVSSNDHKLFNWAMDAYRDGVRQITPEGTLPLEMNRAARALHYHLYALAPLVMLAEFGEANSINLYAERNFAIKRLVARCISGLQDHSYFVQHTGKEQDMPDTISGSDIAWAVPYSRRFPDPQLSSLLTQAKGTGYTTLGGAPPE